MDAEPHLCPAQDIRLVPAAAEPCRVVCLPDGITLQLCFLRVTRNWDSVGSFCHTGAPNWLIFLRQDPIL